MGHKISKDRIANDAEAFTNIGPEVDVTNPMNQSSTEPSPQQVNYHSVTHIGTANETVIIGPVININPQQKATINPEQPKTPYHQHLQDCQESQRVIDDDEIDSIAAKIEAQRLRDICRMLQIKENNLDDWMRHKDEFSPAYRMLYFWAQTQDNKATVKELAIVFADCGQEDAILALQP